MIGVTQKERGKVGGSSTLPLFVLFFKYCGMVVTIKGVMRLLSGAAVRG